MPTILVTGSKGQLGSELQAIGLQYPLYKWIFTDKKKLDITNTQAVQEYVKQHKPTWIINAAAYTAVDKAEIEQSPAYALNADAVKNIAIAAYQHNAAFIHISTDYVFNGKNKNPYTEADTPNPKSVYGISKLLGEQYAIDKNPNTIVIRTSWLYSEYGKNFVKTMIHLMNEKDTISVVNDQQGCPTYALDLARAIMHTIIYCDTRNTILPGIYHYCNAGITTWYDFAVAIKKMINSSCTIKAIPTKQYHTPATRPAYSVLDTQKICHTFEFTIPYWAACLQKCIQKIYVN